MVLTAQTNDFTNIIVDIGQSITINTITRTIASDGTITSVVTANTTVSAIVNEINNKEKILIDMGFAQIGDLVFLVGPSTTVGIYDKIVWNSTTYSVRKIFLPPRFGGELLFKKILAVEDTL